MDQSGLRHSGMPRRKRGPEVVGGRRVGEIIVQGALFTVWLGWS